MPGRFKPTDLSRVTLHRYLSAKPLRPPRGKKKKKNRGRPVRIQMAVPRIAEVTAGISSYDKILHIIVHLGSILQWYGTPDYNRKTRKTLTVTRHVRRTRLGPPGLGHRVARQIFLLGFASDVPDLQPVAAGRRALDKTNDYQLRYTVFDYQKGGVF